MTRPRHYPRFDTSICPNPAQCEKLYHGRLEPGDSCECCGAMIGMEPERFPQYTTCLYCKGVLRRDFSGDEWAVHGVAGTTYTECLKAPNPEDGPMPPHVPGSAILEPPIASNERNEPAPAVFPYIPRRAT